MKSQESYRARKLAVEIELKAGVLNLAVALARTAHCQLSDLLPAYGLEAPSTKRKKRNSPDELVNTRVAGKILGLKPKTLENWRSKGGGPPFQKSGNRCYYRVGDLEAYLAANKFGSTSEYRAG